ncbi:hypothetical protein ACFFKH_17540 [Micromonospora marina]|uniref:DUF4352 domain-containing protein n=1 Tax=Micromonospora marina TaxID=307120 RepID=A0A1C5A1V8_9ACTN|nr:hypothetical protein [Micromonospora marina]SCF39165.1 hypothetical protein GA0070215_12342 [Micromonospora marina]
MSHPQPPSGSPDPNQQPPEPPTQAFPTAPMPPVPDSPYAPPAAPTSGTPYPPPPVSGTPYPPPPVSGAPYPPPGSEYQPPGGYPPPGGAYPPPGAPFGPPAKKSNKNVWITVGVIAVILLLLCCGGGIFAIYSGVKTTQEAIDSLPTPGVTYGQPTGDTPTGVPTGTPQPGNTDDKTFNMPAGDKLVVNDDRGTIEITVGNFQTRNAACTEVMPGPRNGMFLIADVTAEITKGTGSINPFYFTWVAADGTEESGIGGAFSGCGKLMTSGTNLPEGSKRSGQLIFDVKDQNGVVEYKHRFRSAGSWKP